MGETLDYKGIPIQLHVGNYRSEPLCMSLFAEKTNRLFLNNFNISANLGEHIDRDTIIPKYCAYVDASRRDAYDLINFLEENNLAKPYIRDGHTVKDRTGYTEYTLYQFNEKKLKQLDPQGCASYEQNRGRAMHINYATQQMRSWIASQQQGMNEHDGF